jgi:hypothetical protein
MSSSVTSKDKVKTIQLSLHGIGYSLYSNNERFITFANEFLADFPTIMDEPSKIVARLSCRRHPSNMRDHPLNVQYGRRVWSVDEKMLFSDPYEFPGLEIEIDWPSKELNIVGYLNTTSVRQRILTRLGGRSLRTYTLLIYYLVYFPLIKYLEQARGWGLLHAGAISSEKGAMIFSGMPGSGKSSFIFKALQDPALRIVSDNLVFHDGRSIYAFPEPIHVNMDNQQSYSDPPEEYISPTGRTFSHDRQDYSIDPAFRAWKAQPHTLIFIGLSNESRLKALSHQQAMRRLLSNNAVAKEVIAYQQFGSILDLISPHKIGQVQILNLLNNLVNSLTCFELQVKRETDPQKLGDIVMEQLSLLNF